MSASTLSALMVFGIANLALVGGWGAHLLGILLRQRTAERALRLRLALARRRENR